MYNKRCCCLHYNHVVAKGKHTTNKLEVKNMLNISLDEDELKKLYLEEVRKRVEEIEEDMFLIDTKELCRMLSLSRPTVEKLFIYNPNFPAMRVGKKWLFNRQQVKEYINRWSIDVRKKGGSVEYD